MKQLSRVVTVFAISTLLFANTASAAVYSQLSDEQSFTVSTLNGAQNIGNGGFAEGQYLTGCDIKLGLVNSNTVFCRIRAINSSGINFADTDYTPTAGISGTHVYHFDFHGNLFKFSSTTCYLLVIAPDSGFQSTTLYGTSTDSWTNSYTGCSSAALANSNDISPGRQNSNMNTNMGNMVDYYFSLYTSPYNVINHDITDNFTFVDGRPYLIDGNITINSGVIVDIDPGTVIKFANASSSLTVNGTLNAGGTDAARIFFTSVNDDSIGTDMTASSTSGTAGDWGSIHIGAGGIANLVDTETRFGGATNEGMISNFGGTLNVSSSTIATSSTYGIYLNDSAASTSFKYGSIFGTNYGIYKSAGNLYVASSSIYNNTRGIQIEGNSELSEVFDSAIHDNTYGIYSDHGFITVDTDVFSNNSFGVFVNQGDPGRSNISSSYFVANDYGVLVNVGSARVYANTFTGNHLYGVYSYDTSTSTAATYNYWGASDGPNGGGGSGDAVSANVNYINYLSSPHFFSVDLGGNLLSSVDASSSKIYWDGSPQYNDEWYAAVKLWNDLGGVEIATSTGMGTTTLSVATTSDPNDIRAAFWNSNPAVDTLTLNVAKLATASSAQRIHAIAHELGHALGLAHSTAGNIMYAFINDQAVLGTQDISDFNELH